MPPGRDRLLTAAEEIALAKQIERDDPAAKRELVERNLRLVHSLARRYRGSGVPYEDLVQEGTIGLIRAAQQFDHRRAVRFSTYAVWSIRRSLADAVVDERTIRIPANAARRLAKIRRAERELERSALGSPSSEAISERVGLSVHSVRTLRDAASVAASLDEPVGEAGTTLGELIADDRAIEPWRRTDARERHRRLRQVVGLLPDRHREVLLRRYGLQGGERETHAEIGARLGVGEDRSRQLEREALHRLRSLGDTALAVA
jgi:RNA polymerase primary sigma factor